jgi:hypothetical protein
VLVKPYRRDIRPVGGRDLNEIAEAERERKTSLVKISLLVAAALAATFALGELRLRTSPEVAMQHRRMVITPFDNRTRDPALDELGREASARVARWLRPLPELEILPEEAAASAGVIVAGSYYLHADSIRFGIELTDAITGELIKYFAPTAVPSAAAIDYMPRLSKEVGDTIAQYIQSRKE